MKASRHPLPPGPRRIPFLGNALDIDMNEPHVTYTQWGYTYGDVVYFRVLGQEYIVVNSEKVARMLSDTRSVVYADRPIFSVYKLFGVEFTTGLTAYGDTWRVHRKLSHQTLRSDATTKYQELYMNKAISLARVLLEDGAAFNLQTSLRTFAATAVLSLTYGYEIKSQDHPVFQMAQNLLEVVLKETTPEKAALMATFPFGCLKIRIVEHLPSWLPGLGFKAHAATCRTMAKDLREQPFEYTRNEVSASVLHTFVLAMILFPEVQEKARAEIDSVMAPATPLRFDFSILSISFYTSNRFLIDTIGAIVIFNAWAMSRDCVNTDQFDSGRHLLPDGGFSPTARMAGSPFFGFGRRVCPGRFFAEGLLWAAFVQILATLHFSKAKDANGRPIEVNPVFTHGIAS
ncbi:cytochrome P450 [Suillus lakei]|nr:cytochrome P450 [Suillus lakei]